MVDRVTFELVLNRLRSCHFAVLSTVDKEGMPHSAGVNYGVSKPGDELAIYVMTRRHLQKTRNIAHNPDISLVIPVPGPSSGSFHQRPSSCTGAPTFWMRPTRGELTSSATSGWVGGS
jgi:general stress protein 26